MDGQRRLSTSSKPKQITQPHRPNQKQDPNSRYYPGRDGRKYEAMLAAGGRIPLTESLRDVRARAAQHWEVRGWLLLVFFGGGMGYCVRGVCMCVFWGKIG